MFQTNTVDKIKTRILSSVTFFKDPAIYEIMWKNSVQPGSPQTTIWCMHIACWIPTAKSTHSKYVVLIAFPLQHWLHECASILQYMYIVCLVIAAGIHIAVKNIQVFTVSMEMPFALLSYRTFCAAVNNN